jgi:hypothetical protein
MGFRELIEMMVDADLRHYAVSSPNAGLPVERLK